MRKRRLRARRYRHAQPMSNHPAFRRDNAGRITEITDIAATAKAQKMERLVTGFDGDAGPDLTEHYLAEMRGQGMDV